MSGKNMNPLKLKGWKKQIALFVGIASLSALIGLPILAQIYPRYAIFQPIAYPNYPVRAGDGDIVNTLAKDSQFSTLTNNLANSGLTDTLKEDGFFIVFAPTNNAFKNLPPSILEKLIQPQNLERVLKYHVVSGQIDEEGMNQNGSKLVNTLEGNPLKIFVSEDRETVKINDDANGNHMPITATNGTIIEIDKVLLPPGF